MFSRDFARLASEQYIDVPLSGPRVPLAIGFTATRQGETARDISVWAARNPMQPRGARLYVLTAAAGNTRANYRASFVEVGTNEAQWGEQQVNITLGNAALGAQVDRLILPTERGLTASPPAVGSFNDEPIAFMSRSEAVRYGPSMATFLDQFPSPSTCLIPPSC